jgi:hypothetical protein
LIIEATGTASQIAFVHSDAPFPAFVAGYGAGKSHALALRAIRLLIEHKTDIAYYMPTFDLVRLVGFKRLRDLIVNAGLPLKINQTTFTLTVHGFGSVIFRTMDDPSRLVGYEVGHSLLDELDTLPIQKAEIVWQRALARNRLKIAGDHRNTMAVGTTPEGFRFVYEQWGKDRARSESKGYVLFKGRTTDNKHLPPDYVENLKNQYPESLLLAYLDGEFCNLTSGCVYQEFDRVLNGSKETMQEKETLHCGMDFNVANSSLVVWVLRNGDPHAVDELTGVFDTPSMIQVIKSRYANHQIMIYPDASGGSRKTNDASVSDISLLRSAGFIVLHNSTNPAIRDRILAMNSMIHANNKRRLFVNTDLCPGLCDALEKQAYDKNGMPDKQSGLDHIVDAAGYFIAYKYPVTGRGHSQINIGGII